MLCARQASNNCSEFKLPVTDLRRALEEVVTLLLSKIGWAVKLKYPPTIKSRERWRSNVAKNCLKKVACASLGA